MTNQSRSELEPIINKVLELAKSQGATQGVL